MVLHGYWLYGFYITSKWIKEDIRRESIALKDITRADHIAREMFKEVAENTHRYNFNLKTCDFDHISRGIAILRNAAEKGNADAQFTLGTIYAGARLDAAEPYFIDINDRFAYTMLNEKVDLERAAYWYALAAEQGHSSALNNLGNAYRFGNGIEKNLMKATELIKKGAELDDPFAQLSYGDMFRD